MPDRLSDTADAFHEQGYAVLPSVLSRSDAAGLRTLVEERYQDPATHERSEDDLARGGVSLMRIFESHSAFRNLLVLEPVISVVEAILGPDCHVVAQNALRTPPGKAIVNWHIDDALFLPVLEHLDSIPAKALPLPSFSLNVLIALTDVEEESYGPTQVVPGSHLSGQKPAYCTDLPDGFAATSLLLRAGDACLVNSQTWHRGAPNSSDRVRYLVTTTYGRRFISQRFYPFLNYRVPDHVLDGASDRLLRLLGRHDKGPYG